MPVVESERVDTFQVEVRKIESENWGTRYVAQIGDYTEECTVSPVCAAKRALDNRFNQKKHEYCLSHWCLYQHCCKAYLDKLIETLKSKLRADDGGS